MVASSRIFIALALLVYCLPARAQKEIFLVNPSFEDAPTSGKTPNGWYNCGHTGETPPDIQPGEFGVVKAPSHGNTYLGLVVRDNETWEGVGQRLSQPLMMDQCYELVIDMARSETYLSQSRATGREADYVSPVKILVWGGNTYCDKKELLFETPLIINYRWNSYTLRLSPKKASYQFLLLEVFYKTPLLFPYNGNVLLDNASPIRQVVCGHDKMVERPKTPPKKSPSPATYSSKTNTKPPPDVQPKAAPREPAAAPVVNSKMVRNKLKKGDVIRLEHVYFDANQFAIKEESIPALSELRDFLLNNPDVAVEIGGHTNNRAAEDFALKLSNNRAKAVAEWLVQRGIPSDRIQFKGYGWTNPILPNTTEEGRRKNQRVEVKILSISG